jgi:ABC-2 type transport system permease protein
MRRPLKSVFLLAWLTFSVQYRRTFLGPLWVLVGPVMFVLILGTLFSAIGRHEPEVFIPHLTVGVVIWPLLGGLVPKSASVFQRNRSFILQGSLGLTEIVIQDLIVSLIIFAHQLIVVVAVMLLFRVPLSLATLLCLPGLVLILVNGYWVTHLFGILGARFRDLSEVFQAVMRIAFLATPIIWMPGQDGRGLIFGPFLTFNPFYHFIEIFRAPLLGRSVDPMNWFAVFAITICGLWLARVMHMKYARYVSLWV